MRIQRQRETFAYRVADLEKTWADDNSDLLDRLHGEFHKWWEGWGSAYDPQGYWKDNPINSWRNIESFLEAKYPQSYRGFDMGLERARPLIDQIEGTDSTTHYDPYETGIDAVQKYGYDPKEIAAGMLLLHNRSHGEGRSDLEKGDLDRLSEIARIRSQQYRDYEKKKTASGFAYRLANDLVEEYTEQLSKEFHDWIDSQEGPEGRRGVWPVGGPEVPPGGTAPPADYTQPMGGPLTWWDNIEAFVKERYPAAYRGYRYGEENAAQALDGGRMRMPTQYSLYPDRTVHPPYETGPEAVEKYGYDPRQVAAGFMYLHTNAHMTARPDSRVPLLSRDIDRLSEIFQKRQHMQRVYEQNKERENRVAYRIVTSSLADHVVDIDEEGLPRWLEGDERKAGSAYLELGDEKNLAEHLAQIAYTKWQEAEDAKDYDNAELWYSRSGQADNYVSSLHKLASAGKARPFSYMRNNSGMRGLADPDEYGQEYEPWGRYYSGTDENDLPSSDVWERGTAYFDNPLELDWAGGDWKKKLSEEYGGLTGKELSQALMDAGFDAVVTSDEYGPSEMVDIRPKDRRVFRVAAGYSTVHEKVRKDKGAPSGHSCVDCGSKADHWTYDHSSDSEKTKTNDSLPYSTDTKHYSPRCRSCHNKLDKKAAKTPKGVTFELSRTGYGNSQPVVYAIAENPEWSGGINVGELQWYHPNGDPPPGPDNEVNQIKWIKVDPEYQRQGIATAMYEWAKKNANPDLTFSPHMTDDGYAWSKSQGYAPSRWKRFDNRRGSEWVTA